jgi:VCBS repeat-containing protein
VTDGLLTSANATVTITVNAVNDAPTASGEAYSVDEDNTLTVNAASGLLGNDSDVEADALAAVLVSGPSNGSLTLNTDGSFSYTPDANFNGSDSFTYEVSDSLLTSSTATVTITVNPVNDAPVVVGGIADVMVSAGSDDLLIDLTGAFADIDDGSLVYEVAANGNVSLVDAVIESGGTLRLIISSNSGGLAGITIRATDAGGLRAEASFTVSVEAKADLLLGSLPVAAMPKTFNGNAEAVADAALLAEAASATEAVSSAGTGGGGVVNLRSAGVNRYGGGSVVPDLEKVASALGAALESSMDWDVSAMYSELASLAAPFRGTSDLFSEATSAEWLKRLEVDPAILTLLLEGNQPQALASVSGLDTPEGLPESMAWLEKAMPQEVAQAGRDDSSWLLWASLGLGAGSFLAYLGQQRTAGAPSMAMPVFLTEELRLHIERLKNWLGQFERSASSVAAGANKRKHPRHAVDLVIAVSPVGEALRRPSFLTCARDLSKSGIGFVHTQPTDLEQVRIFLGPEESGAPSMLANVCWTRKFDNGVRLCGAQFLEELKALPMAG